MARSKRQKRSDELLEDMHTVGQYLRIAREIEVQRALDRLHMVLMCWHQGVIK